LEDAHPNLNWLNERKLISHCIWISNSQVTGQ